MTRNLKALGLAFVAVFAMSAIAASAAQAAAHISWETGATKLTATQENVETQGGSQLFKITNGSLSVTCNEVHATVDLGTSPNVPTTSEITTTTPLYTDSTKEEKHCRGPLGTSPEIDFMGCDYRFTATDTEESDPNKVTGTADIVCDAGEGPVTIKSALCSVNVKAQGPLSHVTFKNVKTGTKEEVTLQPTITGIHYEHSGLCGTGTGNDGTYEGNVTITAENDEKVQKDVTVT